MDVQIIHGSKNLAKHVDINVISGKKSSKMVCATIANRIRDHRTIKGNVVQTFVLQPKSLLKMELAKNAKSIHMLLAMA